MTEPTKADLEAKLREIYPPRQAAELADEIARNHMSETAAEREFEQERTRWNA